jgi:hypothetical protein
MWKRWIGGLGGAAFILCCGFLWGLVPRAVALTPISPTYWNGTWRGVYECAQGITGLDLTITVHPSRRVTAIFSFYAVPKNPDVPSGEFVMTGEFGPSSAHLLLHAGSWTTQPLFYVTVDLDGDFRIDPDEYRGKVLGPGCSVFRLRRDTIA